MRMLLCEPIVIDENVWSFIVLLKIAARDHKSDMVIIIMAQWNVYVIKWVLFYDILILR